jgi:hypothetical protein
LSRAVRAVFARPAVNAWLLSLGEQEIGIDCDAAEAIRPK